ncbi:MAG: inner membrane CreD family protein [Chiayiivirga sp.]|nr:inner membrane CreD family protein [Chiayiivirga sp.]
MAADIANSSSRAQTMIGPLLRIEIERSLRKRRMVGEGALVRSEEEIVRERESRLLTPTQLEIDGSMGTQTRRRGLFEARVYDVDMQIGARFAVPALPAASDDVIEQRIVGAALVLGLAMRAACARCKPRLGGVALTPEPGSGLAWNAAGLHLPLSAVMWQSPLDLKLDLDLIGTESLQWLPVGDDTRVSLRGDWPHPSFEGQFLRCSGKWRARPPLAPCRDSTPSGASRASPRRRRRRCGTAAWQRLPVPRPATRASACACSIRWIAISRPSARSSTRGCSSCWCSARCSSSNCCVRCGYTPCSTASPASHSRCSSCCCCRLASTSGSTWAYVVAAAACVGLVATYMAAPLGSTGRAAGFGALLAALYALLYGLLQSEDYALLMGALALFALLATAMLLTRRLDWYRLGETRSS